MAHKTLLQRMRAFLITSVMGGLVVVLPVTIFIWLIRTVVRAVARILDPVEHVLSLPEGWAAWVVDLTAFGITLGCFFLIGLVMQTKAGKAFFSELEDRLLEPLPLYSTLRDAVQQMLGQGKRPPFQEVVLVDVYSNKTRMLGFVVDELPDDYLSLFVPTGPNPTNGFVFFCHKDQVTHLKARPEDAVRVVIGVGTGAASLFEGEEALFAAN